MGYTNKKKASRKVGSQFREENKPLSEFKVESGEGEQRYLKCWIQETQKKGEVF